MARAKSIHLISYINFRQYSKFIPEAPTWDLIAPKRIKKISNIELKKLEKCSMLTIDEKIANDLNDAINIVERMCNANVTNEIKSHIYYEHLGSCELREDNQKLFPYENADKTREKILQNAAYTYEDYFVAPPSKSK
ncbi:unnamed protein product [Brachionus calyciflorus]|uniref:Glutamyl-tRNA(Gln) amidotransferase subunit C, mitochondrial n=1 Tax=Brachionus calyciflorus TaxID=104777 RepID=A0A813MB80_9BILA|nr:unnamed protein product [Brachionus calyciflorus]